MEVNPDNVSTTKDEKDVPKELPSWMSFFHPNVITNVLHKKYGIFGVIVALYYSMQFVCCVAACNFYSDASRKISCVRDDDSVIMGPDDSSEVLDLAIKLCGIWHVMEWIRSTVLLTVVFIGVNLMWVWYCTAVTAIYGVGVFLYLVAVYASEDGMACGKVQETRYQWMLCEIIFFFVFFWVYQVPVLLIRCFNKQKLHDALNKESEDEE